MVSKCGECTVVWSTSSTHRKYTEKTLPVLTCPDCKLTKK